MHTEAPMPAPQRPTRWDVVRAVITGAVSGLVRWVLDATLRHLA